MKKFWSKNPSRFLRIESQARAVLIHWPLAVLYHLAELIFKGVRKDVVLFLLPYREYCENTRHLFEYWLANRAQVLRPVLFVYNKDLYLSLREQYGERVVLARSLEGASTFFRSTLCFTSRGSIVGVFRPFVFLSSWKKVVNLWHGIPLKRLGVQARDTWERHITLELQEFHSMIVCSKFEQLAMAACYGFNLDNLWITNVPRNDLLFGLQSKQQPRTVLYAPTWRDGEGDAQFFPFSDVDLEQLERLLDAHDCVMVLRPHLVERANALEKFRGYRRIVVDSSGPTSSLARMLLDTRVLITDYSSIYLDFLALDRPMLFLPYDLPEYERKRGFMLDYGAVTPGPKIFNFAMFIGELQLALERPGHGAESRRRALAYFHEQQDGQACARVADRALQTVPVPNVVLTPVRSEPPVARRVDT